MLDKMTDEAIRTVIKNAPEGAEYWTSGYDVGYRKLVLDCVFGWLPDDKKWIRAIDNDVAMERIDKGFWIPNLVKELVERQSKPIPQTKEVEWDGEYQLEYGKGWYKYKVTYEASNGDMFAMCLVQSANNGNPFEQYLNSTTTKFRALEAPEDREKREREEERVNEVNAMCLRVTSLKPSQARSLYDAGYRCTASS